MNTAEWKPIEARVLRIMKAFASTKYYWGFETAWYPNRGKCRLVPEHFKLVTSTSESESDVSIVIPRPLFDSGSAQELKAWLVEYAEVAKVRHDQAEKERRRRLYLKLKKEFEP